VSVDSFGLGMLSQLPCLGGVVNLQAVRRSRASSAAKKRQRINGGPACAVLRMSITSTISGGRVDVNDGSRMASARARCPAVFFFFRLP